MADNPPAAPASPAPERLTIHAARGLSLALRSCVHSTAAGYAAGVVLARPDVAAALADGAELPVEAVWRDVFDGLVDWPIAEPLAMAAADTAEAWLCWAWHELHATGRAELA